jgi:hypothetical protein
MATPRFVSPCPRPEMPQTKSAASNRPRGTILHRRPLITTGDLVSMISPCSRRIPHTDDRSHAHRELELVRPREPQRPAAPAPGDPTLWTRIIRLRLPVLAVHGAPESPADWHQLLQPARPAQGVYQRRQEHVGIPRRELWLQARGHGHSHG